MRDEEAQGTKFMGWWDTLKDRDPSLYITTIIAAAALVLIMIETHDRNRAFVDTQKSLMFGEATSVAAELHRLIDDRRRTMAALARDNRGTLTQIVQNPDDKRLIDGFRARLKSYFPEMYAYTVADGAGQISPDEFGEFVGDICREDIAIFRSLGGHYTPWVHPKANSYHYDVMVPWNDDGGVFFVSFHAESLARIVANYQLPNHRVMLMREDIPDLIEVTAEGPRSDLGRDIRLSAAEQAAIEVRLPVKDTRWLVAVMPKGDFFAGEFRANRERGAIIALVVFGFWVVSVFATLRYRKQRQESREELTRLATRDSLTGVSNRRHFLEVSAHIFADAKRYERPVSIILLDVDHFKKINDHFGHQIGDLVLKELAQLCMASARETDVFGRIGGEEFAFTLGNTDIHGAHDFAERLRIIIADHVIDTAKGPLTLTASMGAAERSDRAQGIEPLMAVADQELYRAKEGGRNRVCAAKAAQA